MCLPPTAPRPTQILHNSGLNEQKNSLTKHAHQPTRNPVFFSFQLPDGEYQLRVQNLVPHSHLLAEVYPGAR